MEAKYQEQIFQIENEIKVYELPSFVETLLINDFHSKIDWSQNAF